MMALAANHLQHVLPSFDPTTNFASSTDSSSLPYESDASVEESEDALIEEEDFDIVESEEPTQSEIAPTPTPTLAANAPDTTTTTNILITRSTSPAVSQDRPSSPSLQDVPSLVLTFKSNTYNLFSPFSTPTSSEDGPELLFTDKLSLYKAPLQNLMFELKEHFSVSTDVTLDFPELQLSFGLNMIYAQKVTLAHVHLLTQGLENHVGKSIPFSAILVEAPNSFLSQYNRLIELAQQVPTKSNVVFTSSSTGIPIPVTPTKSSDAPSKNVPTSVQTSEYAQSEQDTEVEPEIEEEMVEPNTESNVETLDANTNETSENATEANENEFEVEPEAELEAEPEVLEEDLNTVEDAVDSKTEKVVEEQTNSEDVEVEFDELNTELTVADDVVYASTQKLHARRWDDDHRPDEIDELERKRQKFTNNQQEERTETTSDIQEDATDLSVTST